VAIRDYLPDFLFLFFPENKSNISLGTNKLNTFWRSYIGAEV
jgi:hypothetical protein